MFKVSITGYVAEAVAIFCKCRNAALLALIFRAISSCGKLIESFNTKTITFTANISSFLVEIVKSKSAVITLNSR